MAISGSGAAGERGVDGGRGSLFSSGAAASGVFVGDDARERGVGRRRGDDFARASRSCSGAWLEKAIDGARRNAGGRS
jgi:hypothetical protein